MIKHIIEAKYSVVSDVGSIQYNLVASNDGMPIYSCDCGVQILIVPDVSMMNGAIKNHLAVHKKLTGKTLTEESLAKRIIVFLSKSLL